VAPYPYYYHARLRYGESYTEEQCVKHTLEDLNIILKTQTSPSETAAVLIEPVLGEGGYVPAPPAFMKGLREICSKNGILLIADEVQSGFGRTGRYFSIEHSGVIPDIMTFAKGVASGMPLSGIVSTHEFMSKQPPGSMGGTYAGNAISCRAASATLDVFKDENIIQNVQNRGKQIKDALEILRKKYSFIGDVRGLGLMVGIEFCSSKAQLSSAVANFCYEEGLVLLTCSAFDTIRFIPPLNVSEEEINIALKIFEKAIQKASALA